MMAPDSTKSTTPSRQKHAIANALADSIVTSRAKGFGETFVAAEDANNTLPSTTVVMKMEAPSNSASTNGKSEA